MSQDAVTFLYTGNGNNEKKKHSTAPYDIARFLLQLYTYI